MVFTGIIQKVGKAKFIPSNNNIEVTVDDSSYWSKANAGDSIAINGVCLTLLEKVKGDTAKFFVMEETRKLTNLESIGDDFERKDNVNVEHALQHGDSLGGHHVLGHVDGVARVSEIIDRKDGSRDVWIDISSFPNSAIHLVHKGSICMDGTSLTVAEIRDKTFRVSLIHHTLAHTNLQYRRVGDQINIEFDTMLKTMKMNNVQQAEQSGGQKMEVWDQKLVDEDLMEQAFLEAMKGRTTTAPNPWVGCVIVDKNRNIIGRGYHVRAGQAHAEVNAVLDVEKNGKTEELEGATAYVTLEPCHHHGRTPPCDRLLIEKKVKRVVISVSDPDERVNGEGLNALRDAGIEVTTGVLETKGKEILAPYLYHRRTGLPYVVLKVAISIDGKIACEDGTSQWITCEASRRDAHVLRSQSQAIMVGSNTARKDDPKLNVRLDGETVKPLRVLLDTKGSIREGHLMDKNVGPTIVYTGSVTSEVKSFYESNGIEHKEVEIDSNGIVIESVLKDLGQRGILQLMVEGGSQLHTRMMQEGKVQRWVVYQGSTILGDGGMPWIQKGLTRTIGDVVHYKLVSVEKLEDDVKMIYVTRDQ
ncbi:diaminohydroxyphosphoribosylaminopyrimidine deaminase / 5-amino-6-(5-phosphoribosylamino)uracil reductase [Planoprotostelium fungivorum]|uniref:Diaminohydroxyphosphoribosylaminopyrimidine deaminase / 5-amino-6-(5-phosphoribosylamino)uracil reductase n=1 Tax=Planoprotostelium fungivorum TaxID=1890364 RepID=A0A2P6NIL6_9EUKA|nr:diaminohydroxyphosphoribosylaminopyrimidine deaminase / 5-amino-6-(5-phosphoribosylamino)uracil reductase [Planoprotostelium fungivorum]